MKGFSMVQSICRIVQDVWMGLRQASKKYFMLFVKFHNSRELSKHVDHEPGRSILDVYSSWASTLWSFK